MFDNGRFNNRPAVVAAVHWVNDPATAAAAAAAVHWSAAGFLQA